MTHAQYWEYDPRIGKRWNLDPKPTVGISQYATFFNNPIWFEDRFGDSSIVDDRGYIIRYDPRDKDLRVFMQTGKKQTLIGELGKTIDANGWFKNLLKDNGLYASILLDPILFGDNFKTRVEQDGVWDYKYRSSANQNDETKKLPYHIIGIAFQRKDTDPIRGVGDLPETMFTFDGNTGRAEDLNNFHFGVIGKAFNLFSEEFMLKTAGGIEMQKRRQDFKDKKVPTPYVPASWRPLIQVYKYTFSTGGGVLTKDTQMLAPYGDNPTDQDWIKRGFEYYKKHSKDFPRNIL